MYFIWTVYIIVSKGAKITNRYNQVPHLTQAHHVVEALRTPIWHLHANILDIWF